MKRRGQVTAYIIIALVVLISLAVLLFFREEIIPAKEISPSVEEVPVEFKPVQKFVEFNLENALVSAIKNLGQHAGYVDPYSYAPIDEISNPTEAVALKPFFSSSRIIPYWYYMESPNQCDSMCTFKTLKPKLNSEEKDGAKRKADDNSIEAQIDRYIEGRMQALDFSDFKLQNLDVVRVGQAQVTTRIGEKAISVELTLPLQATKDSTKQKLQLFNAQVNMELKRVYSLADTLTSQEQKTHFIENYVLELLSVYSGMAKGRLPPIGRTVEFGTSPQFWNLEDIRTQLGQEVLSKVSAIPIKGTQNFALRPEISTSVVVLGSDEFQDMDVYFSFPDNRPYYLGINGLDRGMLGPNTITSQILFYTLIINKYAFAYDISFPVLVTAKLPYGLNGEDYLFQFAVEANIRGNQPLFEGATGATEGEGSTMLCDQEQALSGDIALKAQTNEGKPIEGVDVYYHCAGEGCYIGKTDRNGGLKAKLPMCVGGLVVPIKDKYVGDPVKFDTQLGKSGVAPTLKMDTTKSFQVDLRKVVFEPSASDYKWPHEFSSFKSLSYPTTEAAMELDEGAFILFKRISTGGLSTYQFPVYVKGGETAQAMLTSGDYEVEIRIFKDKQLVIPEHKCGDLAKSLAICIPSDKIVMNNSVQVGGGTIKGLKLTSENMGSNRLTLHGAYLNIYSIPEAERKPTDLTVISKLDDYSVYLSKYPPVFS